MPHNPKDAGKAATAASFRLRRVGAACAVHSHELPASGELQLLITGCTSSE
jgi:hypothetical protein